MANPEHFAILEQGVEIWNRWRSDNLDVKPDLSDSRLVGWNLKGANFEDSRLWGAELDPSDITIHGTIWASWYYSGDGPLRGTDLTKANLRSADLTHANLSGAAG